MSCNTKESLLQKLKFCITAIKTLTNSRNISNPFQVEHAKYPRAADKRAFSIRRHIFKDQLE